MKAFTVNPQAKVHLYEHNVPMSWGYPRLMDVAAKVLKGELAKRDVVVFSNKKANYVKILYYRKRPSDTHGVWHLHCARTEGKAGTFDVESAKARMDFAAMDRFVDEVVFEGRKKTRHLKAA